MVRENGYTKPPRRDSTWVGCFNFKSACVSYLRTISLDRSRFCPISSREHSPFPSSPNFCLRTTLSFGFKELSCKQYRRTMLNSIRFWIVLHQLVIQTQAPPQANSSLHFLEYTVFSNHLLLFTPSQWQVLILRSLVHPLKTPLGCSLLNCPHTLSSLIQYN
jgi:hypothetical protein